MSEPATKKQKTVDIEEETLLGEIDQIQEELDDLNEKASEEILKIEQSKTGTGLFLEIKSNFLFPDSLQPEEEAVLRQEIQNHHQGKWHKCSSVILFC